MSPAGCGKFFGAGVVSSTKELILSGATSVRLWEPSGERYPPTLAPPIAGRGVSLGAGAERQISGRGLAWHVRLLSTKSCPMLPAPST